MARGKGNKGKGNTKQDQPASTKVNTSDDRGNEVKNLKSLNQSLLITITSERKQIDELKNALQMSDDASKKLLVEARSLWDSCEEALKSTIEELKNELTQTRILNDSHEKICTQLTQEKNDLENKLKECNDESKELQSLKNELNQTRILSSSHEKLCTQLAQEKGELENKLKECNNKIQGLQSLKNELNQTRILCENYENLCSQLEQEKNMLENKVKECNDMIEEVRGNMSEDICLSDMQTEIVKLQNKLDSVINEKKVLNHKHEELCAKHRNDKNELRKCNEGAKKLKAKMVEDQKLWESCRVNLEGKITEQQNEIDEARKLSKKHEELCSQLMQEKIKMEEDLKKINDSSKKLNAKMTEDEKMWDFCMTNLEGRVVGLQNQLNEIQVLSQGHEEMCTKLRQEKKDLENKLKEFNDINKELENKIIEFDACKVELKGRVAELQDELNETRKLCQENENLSTELRQKNTELGNKLKESNDESKELKEKLTEDGCLWSLCKAELEGTVARLQNELNEIRLKYEEFCIQLRDERKLLEEKLEEFDDETKELKTAMTEDRCLWDSSKAELESTIAELQNELNETRLKHDAYYIHLRDEKEHLQEKLKGYEYKNKELHVNMIENASVWNTCKANLEKTIAELQNELNESRILSQKNQVSCNEISKEKNELENKLIESINETKELKENMAEDGCLWEICKEEFEDKVAKSENEVEEARMLGKTHEKLWSQSREENNEFENKVKQCNDMIEELQGKMNEDRSLWDTCKADMQGEIVKLQDELDSAVNEREVLKQRYEELCAKHRNDKNELRKCDEEPKKLKDSCSVNLEGNIFELQNEIDGIKKLNAKMTEDKQLWDSCKTKLECMVSGLQNELNATRVLSQGHEELCTKLGQEKNDLEDKLKELNDINKELQNKMIEDGLLFDACKVELKGRDAKLNATRQKLKEFFINLRAEKKHLEKKLKGFDYKKRELQNKLNNKTNFLCQNHEKECTVLREQKSGLQKKLKECNDKIKELNAKLGLWGTCKENLQGKVAGLLYEKRIMSQEHDELCNHLTDEKHMLEHKLNECNDRNNKLHAQTNECNNKKTCKADFNISVKISVRNSRN
ncbi:hypothetical protein SUGI_0443160 [Cryptomeria japonica]|nr:hypothetical protein SUGI_0443160 [Cryptomeria japonica]